MPDADTREPAAEKPEPIESPVDVTVNGVKVVVTLLLKPGTTVSVKSDERPNDHQSDRNSTDPGAGRSSDQCSGKELSALKLGPAREGACAPPDATLLTANLVDPLFQQRHRETLAVTGRDRVALMAQELTHVRPARSRLTGGRSSLGSAERVPTLSLALPSFTLHIGRGFLCLLEGEDAASPDPGIQITAMEATAAADLHTGGRDLFLDVAAECLLADSQIRCGAL